MQIQSLFAVLTVLGMGSALPVRREVPQEHSHEAELRQVAALLAIDNPEGIQDPVFGLLGNGAAAAGAGSISNLDCLQQATADRAFTNAKAAGDIDGMVAALTYRALERNTISVGLKSVLCTETAANPEIAALTQHQDPASEGAAAANKAITLTLAQQIASVGGNPQLALRAGTFAPGEIGDPTAAGNTCDDATDAAGCIFSQNLLVADATAAEIDAAVAGAGGAAGGTATGGAAAGAGAGGGANVAVGTDCPAVDTGAAAGDAAGTGDAAAGGAAAGDASAGGAAATPAAGVDIGQCTDFSMTFAGGQDGRAATEFTFLPTDQTNFGGQSSALNPAIISNFMCDQFVNGCGKSAATRDVCKTVKADIDAQLAAGALARDQTYADAWLSGLETAFGVTSTGTGSAGAAGGAAGGAAAGGAAAGGTNVAVEAGATGGGGAAAGDDGAAATGGAAAGAGAAGVDVGPCTDFSMTFAAGQDGRGANEFSFLPTNFGGQSSALNPAIISNFMCNQFVNGCAKSAATRDVCQTIKADIDAQLAAGTLARDQTYADAWLSGLQTAFGSASTGTGAAAGGAAGAGAAGGAGAGAGADAGTDADAGAAAGANDNAATGNEAATGDNAGAAAGGAAGGAAGNNVQTFTGALNGFAAPAVIEDTTADRPFSVNGSTFLNKAAALGRSCDVQKNGCGAGDGNVGACDAQANECRAAAGA